jgi:lactate dehydrogenase-like 2-hydroxyacid dehydrogenase
MKKILVTGSSIKDELLDPLVTAGYDVVHPDYEIDETQLIKLLDGCEAYIYGGEEEASPTALGSAENLKLLAFYGVGYESFMDVDAVKALGIRISNTPGTLTNSVAEMTIAQLINCKRKLVEYSLAYMKRTHGKEEVLSDIGGHNVGIVGLGEIGTRIAEILSKGFGSNVKYYSRTRKKDIEKSLGIEYVDLDKLFKTCEAIIVMTPGNSETASLIGAKQIGAAQDGLILVNTARPEIIDQASLLDGIVSGKIGCAAFDKFYSDSEATKTLLEMQPEKLIITNHVGSLTHDARDAMTRKAVNTVLNFLASGSDEYLVE